jgi:hypothetical protein
MDGQQVSIFPQYNTASPSEARLGPTPAMTFYLLGIQPTSAQGATWSIAPVLSGLPAAQGGMSTGLGFFGVNWVVNSTTLSLALETPAGTQGAVTLPGTGPLTVDGQVQDDVSGQVELAGGNHTITRAM